MRMQSIVTYALSLFVLSVLSVLSASAVEPVAEAPRASGWGTEVVASGLKHPWGMAFCPMGTCWLPSVRGSCVW